MIDWLFPYSAESYGFVVRVSANYMADQSQPARSHWVWAYHIRIENAAKTSARLISRRWEIRDARGALNIVEGAGVVGEQPVIRPGECYDYVSGCPLGTPHGTMVGSYQMRGGDGVMFDIAIPLFELSTPVEVRG